MPRCITALPVNYSQLYVWVCELNETITNSLLVEGPDSAVVSL
jgi:hypothetical protein